MYSRDIATGMLQVAPAVCRLQGPRIDDPPLLTLILREKSIKSEGLPVISRPGPPTTHISGLLRHQSFSFYCNFSLKTTTHTLTTHYLYTMDGSKIIAYVIALIFPPLAVLMSRGVGMDLLINIICCILGWIPGMLHACYIVSKDE